MKIKDLTGQRFGKLLVIRPTDKRQNGGVVGECLCDCGNICYVRSGHLCEKNGTKSCGCYVKEKAKETCLKYIAGKNKKDITNQRFGCLIALEPTNRKASNNKTIVGKCRCDCGSITYVPISHLTNGHTKSCGCIKSYGEKQIAEILTSQNVVFIREGTGLKDNPCIGKNNRRYRFDFYLPEYNCCIEYNGIQHYKEKNTGAEKESLKNIQQRDFKKQEYCKDNNIKLITIPYFEKEYLSGEYLKLKLTKGD